MNHIIIKSFVIFANAFSINGKYFLKFSIFDNFLELNNKGNLLKMKKYMKIFTNILKYHNLSMIILLFNFKLRSLFYKKNNILKFKAIKTVTYFIK